MENKYYPHLFQKGTVGGVVLKNRIVRNSMGTYLGNPTKTVFQNCSVNSLFVLLYSLFSESDMDDRLL